MTTSITTNYYWQYNFKNYSNNSATYVDGNSSQQDGLWGEFDENNQFVVNDKPNYKADNITTWLTDAYGIKIEDTDDLGEILAKLSSIGVTPFSTISSYITDLNKGPLGDLSNIREGNATQLKKNSDYYYELADNDYFLYTQLDDRTNKPDLVAYNGVKVNADGLLEGKNQSLEDSVSLFINEGVIGIQTDYYPSTNETTGKLIQHYDRSELIDLYRTLSNEMSELKKYTLNDKEIAEIQKEIADIRSINVEGNLRNQIDKAEEEFAKIFKVQMKNLVAKGEIDAVKAFFKGTIPNTDEENINGEKEGEAILAADMSEEEIRKILFGENGNYVTDNAFYRYFVQLKSDSSASFDKSLEQNFSDFNQGTQIILGTGSYTGVTAGQEKLSPIDVMKDLYVTQELLALYQQYEEVSAKANHMQMALDTALVYSAEFDFRKALAQKVEQMILEKDDDLGGSSTLALSNYKKTVDNTKRGSILTNQGLQESFDMSTIYSFQGIYGNVASTDEHTKKTDTLVDPYILNINGTQYVLGRDTNQNSTIDDLSEILGINDTLDNPFASLISLDSNNDKTISQEELLKAGIILNAVSKDGTLTKSSYDTSLLRSIDLNSLTATDNNSGIVGTFNALLTNGNKIDGVQTFDDQSYFNKLFGKPVDLSPYQNEANAISTTEAIATSTQILTNQIKSIYSALDLEDSSSIESILDSVCWKKGAVLTPAQRLKMIESVDPLALPYQIEKEFTEKLKTLNISA